MSGLDGRDHVLLILITQFIGLLAWYAAPGIPAWIALLPVIIFGSLIVIAGIAKIAE